MTMNNPQSQVLLDTTFIIAINLYNMIMFSLLKHCDYFLSAHAFVYSLLLEPQLLFTFSINAYLLN